MVQIGLFSSAFFTLLAIIFCFIFRKQTWIALLGSSLLTLGLFMPVSFGFLLVGTIITYFLGNKSQNTSKIGVGIGVLIGALVSYKLWETWMESRSLSLGDFWNEDKTWQIMGLSFFVFNAISYLMDIKRGYIKSTDSIFKLAAYLLYFPTLYAGPLHRFNYLNEQFDQAKITKKSFNNGMRLILWGLFKNFVVAQRLNQLQIELRQSDIGGWWTLLIGFIFFFYLYFSFSSFVDFFQGVSEIFNVRLKDNFHKRVYLSRNRHEFWRGWHITLNEWFRDYFFYWQMKFNFWRDKPYFLLLMTYLLIGIWHGITWNFFIWGFINACWILVEKRWKIPERIDELSYSRAIGIVYHLSICSFLALVFIFSSLEELWLRFRMASYFPTEVFIFQKRNVLILLVIFTIVDQYHCWSKDLRMDMYFESLPPWKRRLMYVPLILSIIFFGVFLRGIDNYYLKF
ncbi:MBOAT family O-acyltransferase [Aquirufa aurantiipilula]